MASATGETVGGGSCEAAPSEGADVTGDGGGGGGGDRTK